MPTLRQMEYLVALEDTGHFGRAAASIPVTQPTLSQQLKALEKRLQVKLVERGKPLRLTPIGREIAARARRMLMDVSEIRHLAEQSRTGAVGTIRFGVSPTLGPYLIPPAVVRLHRENPLLRMYIREGIPDDQFAELARGTLDMVLAPLPVAGGGLHVEPLFREPLSLVGAPDHPLHCIDGLRSSDFAGQPVLSLDRRHHFHRQALDICRELGAELMRDYEGTSLDSLRQMAGSGLGLAILPELYLRSETGGEDMVRRFAIEDWSATRSIAAVWREGAAFAGAYAAIAEVIAAEAREILR
ncbi:LysR family transcriptional regulator [Altererythrobacter sediminis]|uniref:LysR family transcriptional regulator n=2 Tax=Allopontixanthobacter sediminis TaxID=1689985 RepID=A0A845B766_9SPHN|nr:LysR family transcriptional regulator [Allopontixanthobacter sediminis]